MPLIVLWAGYETTAKVIILFLFAFFPMVINTYQGVKAVDPKLLEVGRAFRCSERQFWGNIVLPASLPFIVTGIRLAVGRGMIGMVLADLYTAISGIGYLIVRTAGVLEVDRMFVPIVTLGLLGVTLTAILRYVEKRVAPWTAAVGKRTDAARRRDEARIKGRKQAMSNRTRITLTCALALPRDRRRGRRGLGAELSARPCARSMSAWRSRRRTWCTPRPTWRRRSATSPSIASTPTSSSSRAGSRRPRTSRSRRAPRSSASTTCWSAAA